MINWKFMLMTIFIVSLLAISAVSASEDAVNEITASDMSNSQQELNETSDVSMKSTDDDLIEHEKEDVLESTDEYVNSMVDDDAWYNDKIIWYDGDWDNVEFPSLDYVEGLENPENITVLLSCEDNPIANVDLAFLNDYDNKLTKLTTDSDGIAVYNIPFNVKEFSFCVSFWHDENHMISCVDIGPYMVYLFKEATWKNANWDDTNESNNEWYNNSSGSNTDSGQEFNANDNGTFTALQNLVDTAPAGSTIYWENDYKVDKEFFEGYGRYFDGIIISKRLTIDGKGHTIYGGGERGTVNIFTISADVPVTLKNMILDYGSRAIVAVSNLNIINCTFTNHTVLDREGGAIYCEGKLTVVNSNFTDNHAVYFFSNEYSFRGGAIICGRESTIFNTTFNNNEANRGSAVSGFHSGDVTLTDCTFYRNYCYNNGQSNYLGPVIFNGNVVNCRFIDYTSSDNIVNGNVYNCTFTGDSILTVNDVTKFFGSSDKLQINLVDILGNGIGNADVDVIIDNGNILTVKTDSKGRASVDLNLGIGEHDVVSSYEDVSTTSKVTVESTITASDMAGTYSNSKATATFLDTAGNVLASNRVTFKIGTSSYAATTNSNGVASANIPLGVGTYTVTAVNPVNKEEKTFKLVINKANSKIALASAQKNGVVTLTATLTPASATGSVVFSVNGENKNVQITNGKATLTLKDLKPGNYAVTASYNGDKNLYASTSNTVVFNIAESYPVLSASPVTKTYGTSTKLVVYLKDNKGNAIANAKVIVNINNKVNTITTSINGQATMPISIAPGSYTATITYATAMTTAKIAVKKATVKMTAKAKSFKKSVKTKKYTITLKNNLNKAMKNTKVIIKVNKKTYYAKTNKKGVATFKITKLNKKGKYTATVTYKGNAYYNKLAKKVKIRVR